MYAPSPSTPMAATPGVSVQAELQSAHDDEQRAQKWSGMQKADWVAPWASLSSQKGKPCHAPPDFMTTRLLLQPAGTSSARSASVPGIWPGSKGAGGEDGKGGGNGGSGPAGGGISGGGMSGGVSGDGDFGAGGLDGGTGGRTAWADTEACPVYWPPWLPTTT